MAGHLSKDDNAVIHQLREAKVLRDVEGYRLDQRNGVIFITCSDGDQFADIYSKQCEMQADQRTDPRVHVLSCHGGAIAYAPCSPVNRRKHADLVFLEQIGDARTLKNINTVALYGHGPCGAAAMCNLDLTMVIALQMRAKEKIKALNNGVKVAPFFHIDYGNERKRTYFLCQKSWQEWANDNGVKAIC